MGELFDRYSGEILKGKDIVIGREHRTFFVSERDEVFCYAGICLNEEDAIRRGLFVHPYYMDERHSTDKKISGMIRNFYRIADGCIYLDEYVDGRFYGDRNFKRLDVGLRLPSADIYYGVLLDHQEDGYMVSERICSRRIWQHQKNNLIRLGRSFGVIRYFLRFSFVGIIQ